MSTTTERSFRRRVLAWIAGAALALAGSAAIMLGLPFVGPPGRLVAVIGEPAVAVTAVTRAGGRVVEIHGSVVLARSQDGGFARRLYRAGASVVLEGRVAAGCLAFVDQAGSAFTKAGA